MLIDYVATHNFVSSEAIKELGIGVKGEKKFSDQVGYGYEVHRHEMCKGLELEL